MVIKKQKTKKFYILLIAAVSFLSVFSILLPAPQLVGAQAIEEGGALAYMGKNCNKMKKTSGDEGSKWANCERIQDALKRDFGCDGGMFYSVEKQTDPDDTSIKETLWYTNPQKYSACVEKVQAKLNYIKAADPCGSMKREGGDSQGWKDCEKAQYSLVLINCSDKMFKERPDKPGYWTQKPEKLTDCQQQINIAKNIKLTDSDGNEATAENSAPPPAGAGGGAGAAGDDAQPDCDATKGVVLSWIICPVIDAGVGMTDYAFNKLIRPLLEDIPVSINPDDPSFKAWSSFRILGNVLLVGSLLMVVYSQARGPK